MSNLASSDLKITAIRSEAFSWPRAVPITNGKHTYTHAGVGIVRIETDGGITGLGMGGVEAVEKTALEGFARQLIGKNPLDTERLWHELWVPKLTGRRGLTTRAISAIDIGLWDLKAKFAGLALYKLLGGYRDRVPAYIAGGYYAEGKGLKELTEEMAAYVDHGARAVKMKVGAVSIREDVERVKAVRKAIGPEIKLMIDANCAYRHYEAIQLARGVEEFDPFWFEEPVAPDDYEGHCKLAEQTAIPIATGENEYTRYGFRDLILNRSADILNPDAKVLGGVSEFMKVAAMAQAFDLDVAPHGAQELHVHLVAAVANGLILEFYPRAFDPMWGNIYNRTLELNEDGTVNPFDLPGIGVEPNYEALEKYRLW